MFIEKLKERHRNLLEMTEKKTHFQRPQNKVSFLINR